MPQEMPGIEAAVDAPSVQYMVACENVSFDVNQNITLQNIFSSLTAIAYPTLTPQFFVVFGLQEIGAATYQFKVRITDEQGAAVLDQQLNELVVPPPGEAARVVLRLQQLFWPRAGKYTVTLEMGARVLGAFTLDLKQAVGLQTMNTVNQV